MKVGVVADTHLPRFGAELPASLRDGLRNEGVELIVHLGDFTGAGIPKLFEALAPLEAVAGNNDPPDLVARFGRRKIVPVGGVRLGLVHGDGRRGTTIDRSAGAFAEDKVDVICFGHSRQPRYSYAILDIAHGLVVPRLVFFDRPADRSPLSSPGARSRRAARRR